MMHEKEEKKEQDDIRAIVTENALHQNHLKKSIYLNNNSWWFIGDDAKRSRHIKPAPQQLLTCIWGLQLSYNNIFQNF